MSVKAKANNSANHATSIASRPVHLPGAVNAGASQAAPFTQLQRELGNQAMLQLLESGAIQAKLRVSQPGDADELEADRVASRIVSSAHAPVLQRKCSSSGATPCSKCAGEEEEELHRSVTKPLSIQRAAAKPADSDPHAPTHGLSGPAHLIVADDTTTVERGHMKRSEFLKLLRSAVCVTADAALAAAGKTTKGCPYIEKWLAFYSDQDSGHIERALTKYAPEAARAHTAREYIAFINNRVERAVITWAKTGKITGVPEELASQFMGAGAGFLGALQGFAASGIGGSIVGFLGGASGKDSGGGKGVQRKAADAREPVAKDAESVRAQLGNGHTLDSAVQSQMSSAFGYDFSGVRVHTDAQASSLSSSLSARAFTVGRDVAFASGEYQPGTMIGDALIAHELAHVMQQGGGQASGPMTKSPSNYDQLEEDADLSAVGAVASVWSSGMQGLANLSQNAIPRLRSGLRLQRCSDDHDLEVRGVSDSPEKESIFFDRNSSDLDDPKQREKIPDLKTPRAGDLTLFSFVSEDENTHPEKGVKLAAQRFKTVDKALRSGPNPHIGGQKEDLDTTSSRGKIDYRSMRKVIVKPSGASSGESSCASGGEVACSTPVLFTSAQTEAGNMLTSALSKLSSPLTPSVRTLLKERFGAEDPNISTVATAVKTNLTNLKTHILVQMTPSGSMGPPRVPGHRCANECEPACGGRAVAYNQGKENAALMTLCANSTSGFMAEPNLNERASVLVHEGLHATLLSAAPPILPPPAVKGTKDFSYHGQRLIKFLDPATALKNTDSYLLLVQQLNGITPEIGPDTPDPEVGDDFLSAGPGGEREQVDRSLAWLEGWLLWSRQEANGIYGTLNETLRTRAWTNTYYEAAMGLLAPIFKLTVPPSLPKESDKLAVAAIYDRLLALSDVLFSHSSIEIEKINRGSTAWDKGPSRHLKIARDFFAFPAGTGRNRAQLNLLLLKLLEAHPDISSDFRPKYMILIDKLREHFGGGTP